MVITKFFYDLSFEDYENEDDDYKILFEKQRKKTALQHKKFVYKLNELQETINKLNNNIKLLNNH